MRTSLLFLLNGVLQCILGAYIEQQLAARGFIDVREDWMRPILQDKLQGLEASATAAIHELIKVADSLRPHQSPHLHLPHKDILGGSTVITSLTYPTSAEDRSFWSFLNAFSTTDITSDTHADTTSGIYAVIGRVQDPSVPWCFFGELGQIGLRLPGIFDIVQLRLVDSKNSMDFSRPNDHEPTYVVLWGVVEGVQNTAKLRFYREELEALRTHMDVKFGSPCLLETEECLPLAVLERSPVNTVHEIGIFPEISTLGINFGVIIMQIYGSSGGASETTCVHQVQVLGTPV